MTWTPLNCLPEKTRGCQKNLQCIPANTWRRGPLSPPLWEGSSLTSMSTSERSKPRWVSPGPTPSSHFLRNVSLPWVYWVPTHPTACSLTLPFKLPGTSVQAEVELRSRWPLSPVAVAYYWLKSILISLTSVWFCLSLTAYIDPIGLMNIIGILPE